MASEKQIVANCRNALKSTGPRTAGGKRRSRRYAFRHGLTAITIVETLETAAEFEKFERQINADYSPHTAVESALVARLASLLWRLRRVVACESGLLQIQSETRLESKIEDFESERLEIISRDATPGLVPSPSDIAMVRFDPARRTVRSKLNCDGSEAKGNFKLDLAKSFLRVADSERNTLERFGPKPNFPSRRRCRFRRKPSQY